jgi:glucose/arabinose dehydrogenase
MVGLLVSQANPSLAQSPLASEVVASGLTSPIAFVQDPGRTNVQYVAQQNGVILVIEDGTVRPQAFLDLTADVLSGGEQGLLGLAMAPDYQSSGRFYVHFNRKPDGAHVVARFLRSSDVSQADPSTRFDFLWPAMPDIHSNCTQPEQRVICQPFANHNGGKIAFGPDGYLYVGFGDGGFGNDPEHQAQRPGTLLGKLVRIDVNVPASNTRGYAIPADNPFAGNDPLGALDEIWAFGLRNPWQFSFDSPALGGTGALIIGDVGQSAFEEIDYEPAGAGGRNYGWRNFEGVSANPDPTAANALPLAFTPATPPIYQYAREGGSAIIGGGVYRGTTLTGHQGRYFFGDIVKGRIWSLALTVGAGGEATASNLVEHTAEIGGGPVSAFGIDSAGELYVVYLSGAIARITPGGACPGTAPVANWVCVNGGWVPPDHPLAGGAPAPSPPPSTPPPAPSACPGVAPVANWVCVNGGWVPPDHPLAGGAPAPPTTPPSTPPPPSPSGCPGVAPVSNWVCVNGGWVPPDHPLAGGAPAPPTPPPSTPPPSTPSGCPGVAPVANWVCVNGGWVPPDHPLAAGAPSPPPTPPPSPMPSTCPGAAPMAGWVCVNGGWVPPDHPLAGSSVIAGKPKGGGELPR